MGAGPNQKRRLRHWTGKAIADYRMIEDGDKVMVCVSGGKDSYTLLSILRDLQMRAPARFSLLAVHLDQTQPGTDSQALSEYLSARTIPFRIVRRDTYSVVRARIRQGKTQCSLCARLRRGILYNVAVEEGCSKIALGHHADDIIETFLLNLFFTGSLKAMPPVMRSDDGRNTVIRPLAYCWEADIAAYAAAEGFPVVTCDACGVRQDLKRKRIKELLRDLEGEIPEVRGSMLAALGKAVISHLMDRRVFDFLSLAAQSGDVARELDRTFGAEEECG